MTIGKQITAQRERDRGRRVEGVRIVLLELHERWGRCLPQNAVDSPPREQPEPPPQKCPGIPLHPTDSSANRQMPLDRSPCLYRAHRSNAATKKRGSAQSLYSTENPGTTLPAGTPPS